jgi:hypothetical protein
MKAKRIIKGFIIALICIILAAAIAVGVFFVSYKATVSFDFSRKTGAVMKGASGYLYGIAEDGVPSSEMVESLDIQSVAQKVAGGLQHPTGDIDAASKMLNQAKYETVYLQDIYDSWYYLHDDIMKMRANKSYDWQKLLDENYLPKVEKLVKELEKKPYSNRLVYCLYNECDNGIWFGESQPDSNPDNKYGIWCDYNEKGRENFNLAWKQTYELVKSLNPSAVIGGPGFCDYNREELKAFLVFCRENDCLPEVMIYHELAEDEAYFFDEHIEDYRALERELKIPEREVIISEYGTMAENGYPGSMAQYIAQLETAKVYGDNAYWRLANNLNDNCADANMPNAEWWLMRWYTEMRGQTVEATNKDILSSNFENYFKYHLSRLSFRGFTGIASVSDEGDEIDVVCGGGDRKSRIQLKNLDSTALYGKEAVITVEETVYKGLYGAVTEPRVIASYTKKLGKSESINIGKTDRANAYHITVKSGEEKRVSPIPERYEFEDGTLIGNAYTYDSYCPASGKNKAGHDMVGGMENEGDGVEISVDVPADGEYTLDFIYGNSNDGNWDEKGRQNPDDRADTRVKLSVNGNDEELSLPNTIKSEYTSCYTVVKTLSKGKVKIRLEHIQGTFVLDSLVLTPKAENDGIAVLYDEDRSNESDSVFLAVAPENGYYLVENKKTFLKRGLNYIPSFLQDKTAPEIIRTDDEISFINAEKFSLSDGARLSELEGEKYIDCVSSENGRAVLEINAERAGKYMLTLLYSNNEEGGVHDYNVDLIERYVSLSVNGKKQENVYCRNTYSWTTKNTVSAEISLKKGKNTIELSNDGAVKFNNRKAFAPYIFGVSVNPVTL